MLLLTYPPIPSLLLNFIIKMHGIPRLEDLSAWHSDVDARLTHTTSYGGIVFARPKFVFPIGIFCIDDSAFIFVGTCRSIDPVTTSLVCVFLSLSVGWSNLTNSKHRSSWKPRAQHQPTKLLFRSLSLSEHHHLFTWVSPIGCSWRSKKSFPIWSQRPPFFFNSPRLFYNESKVFFAFLPL